MELNTLVHEGEFGLRGYFVMEQVFKSLARYCASAIRISVAVKDRGVILEALPGVSFSPYTVLVG